MPWEHCENQEIFDDEPCPTCEVTKEAWTIQLEATRTFKVSGRGLRIVLLNQRELGVGEEPFAVDLPDGTSEEGQLDEDGKVKLRHGQSGEGTIRFPQRLEGEIAPYVAEGEESSDEAEPAADAEDQDEGEGEQGSTKTGPATFEGCDLNRRHRFQLQPVGFVIWTLYDEEDEGPLSFCDYSVEATRGGEQVTFEGTTDARGRLDHGAVDLELCTLRVGEGEQPVSPVVSHDAGARVRVRGTTPPEFEPLYEHPGDTQAANPRWSKARCRFDEVVELIYELPEGEEGAEVEFEVFEHDAGGEDDPVATLLTQVHEGVARIAWHVPFVDDSDDEPSEIDAETGFNLPEFVFVARHAGQERRCAEQLVFCTDLELPLVDEAGEPLADTDYVLRSGSEVKQGRTDGEGLLRESGVGPNFSITAGGRSFNVLVVEE